MSDRDPPAGDPEGAPPPGGPAPPSAAAPEAPSAAFTRPSAPESPVTPRQGTPQLTPVSPRAARPRLPVRIFATLALGAGVATYAAVQIDLVRRHFPGIAPEKYWLPQARQITLPGLGATLLCALCAFAFHKLGRRRP